MPELLGDPSLSNLAVRRDEVSETEQAILERCLAELETLDQRVTDCMDCMDRVIRSDQSEPLLGPAEDLPSFNPPRPNGMVEPVTLDPGL
jgi:hypothetical protein